MKMNNTSYKAKKIEKSKNNKGFTLIEIVITMAIFGFLIYVITSVLIVIMQTSYEASQRSQLRSSLEETLKSISNDAQFAQDVYNCSSPTSANNCISLSVPSVTSTGTSVRGETIYYNSSLHAIEKVVTINGSTSTTSYLLSPSNVQIVGFSAIVTTTNIETSITGNVNTGGPTGSNTTTLTIGGLIQFDHQ